MINDAGVLRRIERHQGACSERAASREVLNAVCGGPSEQYRKLTLIWRLAHDALGGSKTRFEDALRAPYANEACDDVNMKKLRADGAPHVRIDSARCE